MFKPLVSLCMIVKNEEKNLPGCLDSVRGLVDEIVIIDTGSEDRTIQIARSFGAKVHCMAWRGDFAAARNESLARACGEWIFYLDADERLVADGLADCVRKTASRPGVDAWSVNIRNHKFGTEAFDNTLNLRLFRRLPGVMFENEVHERVELSLARVGARTGIAPFTIAHFGYSLAPDALKLKLERNLALSAKHLEREPDDPYCLYYLGVTLLLLGRYEECRPYFEKALAAKDPQAPLNAMLYNLVAYLNLLEEKTGDALAAAEKSRKLVPLQNTAYLLSGLAHFRGGEYEEALPFLTRARDFLLIPPEKRKSGISQEYAFIDSAEFHRLIGTCRAETGRYAEAVLSFREYMRLDGAKADCLKLAGLCCVNSGDYAAGLELLEQAEELGIGRSDLLLPKALAHARLHHFDRARSLLEESLATPGSDREKQSQIAELLDTEEKRAAPGMKSDGPPSTLGMAEGIKEMEKSPTLSVCMIVKNEADNIADILGCCESFADEIVVVDTGSTDGSRDIAARFTPNIYDFEWIDDFSAARNFAMSKATGSYQIWLDADDRITPEHQAHINSLKSHFDGKKAFYFVLESHQADVDVSSCLQIRCVPLAPGVRFEGRIHEQLFPSTVREGLELVTTDIVIQHVGYMTPEMRRAKAKRNLAMLESERARGGEYSGIYFYLSLTHASLGDKQAAINCMLKSLELLNKEGVYNYLVPEGYIFLGKLCQEKGDIDSGIRYLIKAKSLINGNPSQNYQIGILFQRMGRHAEAINCFHEVRGNGYKPDLYPTHVPPDQSEIFLHMAYSNYCVNDRPKALQLIQASRMDPARSWEWMGRKALVCQNMGFAQLAFETAMRLGEMEPRSWAHLASIYKLRGFSEKAEQCLKKVEKNL